MKSIEITRRLEFDAGHRIPNHGGQCRNLHGHRYQLEITVTGHVVSVAGVADEGMVLDFGDIKTIANRVLVDQWDHAFLVAKSDEQLVSFLSGIKDHKTVVMDEVPTVENLAKNAFSLLAPAIAQNYQGRVKLKSIRLFETPNCWADVSDDV